MSRITATSWVVALACAISLASIAPARADHGATLSDPVVNRYLEIAAAHWAAAPVCRPGTAGGVHAVLFDDPEPRVSAMAEQSGCRLWLDSDHWPRPADSVDCTIIAHEWGHLLGHQHSSSPGDLMYEQPLTGAPGCVFSAAPAPAARRRVRHLQRPCRKRTARRRAAMRRRAACRPRGRRKAAGFRKRLRAAP